MSTHTVAAIATALSNSGISIIRLSGRESLNIVNKLFKSNSKLEPNKIVYGKIYNSNEFLDEVLVSYFKSPRSFTGEDVCEINCHGGIEITREILELILENGANLAEPGEFTKRAFLNGKLDLTQAEAVINLINSKTKTETKIASKQLEGSVSKRIKDIREKLLELLAHIEVSVDYPEYDYEEIENDKVIDLLANTTIEVQELVNTYNQGKIIKEGINVAILGMPNVGKSSLLNLLAKSDKAIVTNIPGTTRDIVEETISIGDVVLNISDTAGIRDTEDVIEKIGVEKSIKKIDEVDLVIYMLNAQEKISEQDKLMLSKIKNKGIKLIVSINKMDKQKKTILNAIMDELKTYGILNPILMSVESNEGIEILKKSIIKLFNENDLDFEHELIITNVRHKELLKKAVIDLQDAISEINNQKPIDIVSIYIKNVAKDLGEILGTDVSEDIINKIFEKFCVGK